MEVALSALEGHHGTIVKQRAAQLRLGLMDNPDGNNDAGPSRGAEAILADSTDVSPIMQSFINSSNRQGEQTEEHDLQAVESISDEFSELGESLENNGAMVEARCSAAEGLLISAVQALTEPTSCKSAAAIQSLLIMLEENPTLA